MDVMGGSVDPQVAALERAYSAVGIERCDQGVQAVAACLVYVGDQIGRLAPPVAEAGDARMELLPDEWEALADLEAAARGVAESVYGAGDFPAAGRRLKYALAELDKVRGRRAPVGGDRIREDERVQEWRFRGDVGAGDSLAPHSETVYKRGLEKIAHGMDSGPGARDIAVGALAAGER